MVLLLAASVAGLRLGSEALGHLTDNWGRSRPAGESYSLATLAGPRAIGFQAHNRRIVYPYSIVPGGVRTPAELREAAAHDAVVAEHYAGFNYTSARVVQVDRPRLVYLSYRKNGQVRWTRKQASLHPGEKLITDGKITARERCGNQVSVLPQANTSPDEPLIAELDRPDAVASGIEFPSSSPFNSQLLQVDPVVPVGPVASPVAGGWTPVFPGPPGVSVPFPVGPAGGLACVPSKKNNNCKNVPPPPPPTVPEPGTLVLVFTGGATVLVRLRHKNH